MKLRTLALAVAAMVAAIGGGAAVAAATAADRAEPVSVPVLWRVVPSRWNTSSPTVMLVVILPPLAGGVIEHARRLPSVLAAYATARMGRGDRARRYRNHSRS